MHIHDLTSWRHDHVFDQGNPFAERATWSVVALTMVMMVVEVVAGWLFQSMALLADGWHMATHAAALGIAGLAFGLARRWARDARFAFGAWKIEMLGAFTSAVLLAVVAAYVALESAVRVFRPVHIQLDHALGVAVIGLAVNLICARLLGTHRRHHDGHHSHDVSHHQSSQAHSHAIDLNLESAYMHVLADALTSVLAIAALLAGKFAGWLWLDPVAGLVGAALIGRWAYGLILQSARVLLDREMDHPLVEKIRERLESDRDTRVADLHFWRVGREQYACIVTVVADQPQSPDVYRRRLEAWPELAHVSIEVNACTGTAPGA